MSTRFVALIALALSLIVPGAVTASPGTNCNFGGPTPGWRAIRMDLAEPSSFLTLELGGSRTLRPVNEDGNWHLAQGIFVVNRLTGALEAYRVSSRGMAPRTIAARAAGSPTVSAAVAAPDVPYEHHAARLRDGLPAGSYWVVSFGTDGGTTQPNEWWSAGLQVAGTHSCSAIGSGTTFDYDHTDSTDGTMAYVPGAGVAQSVRMGMEQTRPLVLGLMHAETQARDVSTATMHYKLPTGSGTLDQRLAAMISTGGAYSFEASFTGYYPVALVAGVAVTLPS